LRLAAGQPRAIDFALATLVLVVGAAAILHRNEVAALEAGRRSEAESFARILQGLSRSVSPDAIVDAIVEDLALGTGADHIVVVRHRAETNALEATLVSSRPGIPSSTTLFPLSDLDDPLGEATDLRSLIALRVGGEQLAFELEPAVVPPPEFVVAGIRDFVAPDASSANSPNRPRRIESARDWAGSVRDATRGGRVRLPAAGTRDGAVFDSRRIESRLGGASSLSTGAPARIAERIAGRTRDVYGLKHTVAVPLRTQAGVVGAIVVSHRTNARWPASAMRILAGAAVEASAALDRATSHQAAETRASTDALTGLPNRRYFDEFCGLLSRRRRADDAVGVLMVDIDRFKMLNDAHGHAVGDEVLRAVARAIAGAVREHDVPARFGGEEFAVLLRNPSHAVALEVGERVREAVRRLDLRRFKVSGVSVSVGVAVATSADQPIAQLLEQADHALYRAKRAGRDRVVAA
ncbi:MAG TPA: GGDEF domain-containing protein, partial [Candidatus Limnocylindrales bacterium]